MCVCVCMNRPSENFFYYITSILLMDFNSLNKNQSIIGIRLKATLISNSSQIQDESETYENKAGSSVKAQIFVFNATVSKRMFR